MRLYLVFLVGYALFETVWSDPDFTTQPKGREVFVGDDVQFNWGYRNNNDKKVVDLIFGRVNGSEEITIVKKVVSTEVLHWNTDVLKSMRDRIKVQEIYTGVRTSMKIERVQMNDKGIYFCKLSWDIWGKQPTSIVSLQVVDLLITDSSDVKRESWNGHQILVNCAVKVAEGVSVRFTWKRETKAGNITLRRDTHVDTKTQSELTLDTNMEEDYNDLLCIANTLSTEKVHRIMITQLKLPDPPQNLQAIRVFEQGQSVNHLKWEKPLNDGGSPIDKYVVQYKPKAITDWDLANEEETTNLEFKELKLKYDMKIYNAQVRAINKVGRSRASNVVDVQLDPDVTDQGQSRALSVRLVSYSGITVLTWYFVYGGIMELLFS